MKHLTVRNVPAEIAAALDSERTRRGESLNATVIALLRRAVGLNGPKTNGLEGLAGTWTQGEFDEFDKAVGMFEQIDEELWR